MTKSTFGDLLKGILDETGLSRKELASAAQISVQAVGNYINGERKPDYEVVARIATALNISADYLLGISTTRCIDEDMKKACKTTGLSESTILRLQQFQNWPNYLDIIDKLVISADFEEFLSCVYRYRLLVFGEYSPEENEIRNIVCEDQARAMDYLEAGERSPLVTAFLALKSNLDNRDISKFYLNSAQEYIVNAIKHMSSNS